METQKRTAVRIRPKTRAGAAHRAAVFTSIDGTLLDDRTFTPGASRTAVRRLLAAGVPVIPVSVMTLDEIAPIAAELGLQHAMIVEAGGAIARWTANGWEVEACGPPAETLLDVVLDIENRSGASLLVYSALPESEAARLSGRSGEMLQASTHRCYSEPFVIESGELEDVRRAAAEIGFSVRRGRRFLHLCRAFDEGEAFTRLRAELHCDVAIGVGGAAVDAEFLTRADIAIIVPGPHGEPDADLAASVPNARIAPAPGPAGWAAAVNDVWRSLGTTKQDARGA
ncbi:MAG TPA: HAD hydrolase family protein [Thermoanaerobaculia bacterium]|nr:HAD hydrolase family protein [Thermoanaerobaculia bacterium]